MTVLLVMAKAPVAGRVKTRLCPPATPDEAARIATAALLDTADAVRDTAGVTPALALAGEFADAAPGIGEQLAAATSGWSVLAQRGNGFAERLANAHADVATAYPGQPILQIGMDTPQLTGARLTAAARLLASTGAVLGFAADGGWWALGLRDPRDAEVLRDIPMSRPDTGRRTWLALRGRGLRAAPLPVLRDVDRWTDALEVAAIVPTSRFAGQVSTVRSRLPGRSLVAAEVRK